MARSRPSRGLVSVVPAVDLKKTKIPKALQRKNWRGSEAKLKEFAELVGKVRRGEIKAADQKAILGESVEQLLKSKNAKAWRAFLKKYGGSDLLAIEYAQGLGIAELLAASSLPRMTDKAGGRMVIYEFVRVDRNTAGARFHVVDDGNYKGTIVKAIAPVKALVDAKNKRESDTVLRMLTAGIPQHAQDLLIEATSARASDVDAYAPVRAEIAMHSSKPPAIRGSGAWARFPWPKGVDVRKPTGILNLLRA